MSITVEMVYKQFPDFKESDMKRLVGKSEFTDKDNIILARIAAFGDKNLSIFAAKKEGDKFTELIPEKSRPEIVQSADVKENSNEKGNNLSGVISMDTSIFDERLRRQNG